MKKLITSLALALALTAPALAQTTVKLGAEHEVNKQNRGALKAEVYQPVGPVVLGVSVLSRHANEDAPGANELALSAGYTIPYTLYGVAPYVKGEAGVKSVASVEDNFFGLEAGLGGPITDTVSWSAGYRHRDFNKQQSEKRYTVALSQKINDLVFEYSIYKENFNEAGDKNIVAAGVSVAKTF